MRYAFLISFCAAAALGACTDPATGPSSDGRVLPLAIVVAGGPADAFDRADGLAVRVLAGGETVLDTLIPLSANGGDVRTRLRLPRGTTNEIDAIEVEVRLGNEALFRGSTANVTLTNRPEPVEITLQPVVANILGPPDTPTITTLGGTLVLTPAAVFATGDTIPNTAFTWTAMDATIVSVTGNGTVTALAEGDARVQARHGAIQAILTVRVRAIVASVHVTPPRATIPVGGTQPFTATARDLAGNALVRTATWQSSNPAVAPVNANGNAAGAAVGTVTIQASIEGVTGTAELTVAQAVPSAPTGLNAQSSGNTVVLTWTDQATNETSYQVRRGAPGAGQTELVATLGPNVTTYSESPGPDQVLQYLVLACNTAGCSTAASVTTRTVPAPPSQLRVLVTDPYFGGVSLEWTDGSLAETSFTIEALINDYYREGNWSPLESVPENTTNYSASLGSNTFLAAFRIVACNEAGCSAPSNEVEVYFYGSGPGAQKPMLSPRR